MVIEEQQHARQLIEWMVRESLVEQTDIGLSRWRYPWVSNTYDNEARDPRYSTPYKALAFAVIMKKMHFVFYTHVAAEADNEALRGCAETLAREELEHAELFRAERRRAYHAERNSTEAQPRPDLGAIQTEAELLAITVGLDRYFVDAIGRPGIDSPLLADLVHKSQQQLAEKEALLKSLLPIAAQPNEIVTSITVHFDFDIIDDRDSFAAVVSKLQQLKVSCDSSFVFYDALVESTLDESILHEAQAQASMALDRTSVLQQVILNQKPLQKD